jgi:hypothetical protein
MLMIQECRLIGVGMVLLRHGKQQELLLKAVLLLQSLLQSLTMMAAQKHRYHVGRRAWVMGESSSAAAAAR